MIPPAWRDVWICPDPNGHLQAVGTDDAGRRQYLYHPDWRTQRDADEVRPGARGRPHACPGPRAAVLEHLALDGMPLERAGATAVRLLDLGYFRIGSDAYTDEHGSFGLTTLERRHVTRRGGKLVFCFVGKSGIEHCIEIDDPPSVDGGGHDAPAAGQGPPADGLQGRRAAGLLSTRPGSTTTCARPAARTITAKDFRTWHATVLAAVALAGVHRRAR